jgi:uncharacterized protein (TIGR03000 family)
VQNRGHLILRVPTEAIVRVNGFRTRSEGSVRRFVTPKMAPGESFAYELEIAVGDTVKRERVVLRPGEREELAFGAPAGTNPVTTVTVTVPEGAKVFLAGAPTSATGASRSYSTTELAAGERWKDYVVRAVVERDGREIAQERRIDVAAGEVKSLTFDFADERFAVVD